MLRLFTDGPRAGYAAITFETDEGERTITIRRAPFGYFKRCRALLDEVSAKQTAKLREVVIEKSEGETATAEELNAAMVIWQDYADETIADWWRFVVEGDGETNKGLGDGPLPPLDDWPAWLIEGPAARELVNHWRAVPLARGDDGANLELIPPILLRQ